MHEFVYFLLSFIPIIFKYIRIINYIPSNKIGLFMLPTKQPNWFIYVAIDTSSLNY